MDIGVVGAGIVGLSTAVNLVEQRHKVTVYAEKLSPETTSNVAPAVFFPHATEANELVMESARRTFEFYAGLANGASVGLRKQTHYELDNDRAAGEASIVAFGSLFSDFEELKRVEIPGGYEYGWSMSTYFIDSRLFMPYLMGRIQGGGGEVVVRRFGSAEEILALPHEAIANCSSLGAAKLFNDEQVYPVRGQLVYTKPVDLDTSIVHGRFYIFPRGDSMLLGGTNDHRQDDLTPSAIVTAEILEGNRRIAPSLTSDDIIGVNTGLRPYRVGGPRVEAEDIGGKRVLHNYGHGGSGWTLGWGCASMVAELL